MPYSDPAYWRGRAEETRVLAEQMQECVSKQMMRRIAEDYERLARTAEQRAKEPPLKPALVPAVVPTAPRQFARRGHRIVAPPAGIPEIPRFLKRGPATAEEVGAPVGPGPEILMRIASQSERAPVSRGRIAMSDPEPGLPDRPNPKGD